MLKALAMVLVAAAMGCVWKGKDEQNEKLGTASVVLGSCAIAVYLVDWLILGN